MKHLILPLLLVLALLLCACGEAPEPNSHVTHDTILQMPELEQIPVLPGEECIMELHFAQELPAGSVLEVCKDDVVVLTYTVEAATQTVRLTDSNLRSNVGYSLKVNGVLQQHDGPILGRPDGMEPPPDEIPIPSQPAIPEVPEGETIGGFTPGNMNIVSSEGFAPPEGFTIGMEAPEDMPTGALPIAPPEFPNTGELPSFSGGISSDKAPHEPNPAEFRLRVGLTAFYQVGPAN